MTRRSLVLMAVLMIAGFMAAGSTAARADATIESTSVENGYPKQLLFKLTASAPVEIKDVALVYVVSGTGIRAVAKPDEMTAGKTITTAVRVDTNPNTSDGANWIPAGNEFTWHWELALADGTTTVSKDQSFVYLPPNKDWKTVADENFTIYFTGSREALANRFLQAMTGTYQKHGKTLLKTEIPKRPVKLLLMSDAKELQESSPSKGSTIDNSRVVVTCGFRPANARDLIFAAISCGGSEPVDTVRHEFAHILNASAGEGTLVSLPVWLDEGLAVYAQETQDEYTAAFRAAAQSSRGIIPFRQMSTAIADQNQIILQYGEAYTMTKYLIDTYGPGKLNQLLALTKKNTRFDEALKQTYAFDIDGFEKEFKAALTGTRPAATPAPTERPQQQAPARATPAATQAAVRGAAEKSSDDSEMSRANVAIIGVAVVFALLAVFAFLVMMFLQNQRRGRV